MRSTIRKLLPVSLALAILAFASAAQAADTKMKPAAASKTADQPKTERATNRYPIRGKLKAVDTTAKTFTLAGAEKDRVFKTNAQTVFTKGDKTAALVDGKPGDEVGGLVEKQPDGSVLALRVRFGPKPDAAPSATGAQPARGAPSTAATP
ncbi:MAG: hypothetical protein FJ387_09505 [Verrucomicrobia bacterium]|nr:hypothetical protein [Verrucomicrobiota bacterium]